jgi:hypothetical protein
MFTPETRMEKTPGEFGDTLNTFCDYMAGWISQPGRFMD